MTTTEQAIKFWQEIDKHFHTEQVSDWIKTLEAGKGDWFRNYGILNEALAQKCRFGRIGFDEEKYQKLQDWADDILNHYGLQAVMMQN